MCIRIEDNGGGIDPEKIKAKAVANGLIQQAEAATMSTSDALRLIFAPGFSTAAAITDVSGRGVGMDVVRTNIEQIGGTVDIESEKGAGSAIHITLPLTLAIIPSMIVGSSSEKYAIPQTNIAELVRIPESEVSTRIGSVHGADVLRLRGSLLPLVRLQEVLGIEESPDARGGVNIIVVESGPYRYGIAVDRLFDSEEIVVKPLGKQLKELTYLAGATILGDGHVALILDVAGIAGKANLRSCEELEVDAKGKVSSEEVGEKHRLLLFDNAPTDHFAIPMACISRIERTRTEDILDMGGKSLLPYRGGTLPLMFLEDCITADPRQSDLTHVYVVVFAAGSRELGLVTPLLRDICNVELEVDAASLREPGVAGVIVVNDTPTRLLDMGELTRNVNPEWAQREDTAPEPDGKLLLVAEDSAFFRTHVERTLVDEGFQVMTAVDGQDAWEKLQECEPLPAAIVTDVEMPRMNGLELCRHVRSHSRTSQLPVIALTSLASDEDKARGRDAGVNSYQVKMDRESLVQALTTYCVN